MVYIDTGKTETEYSTAIFNEYMSAINSLLGNSLQVRMHDSICFQQMVFLCIYFSFKDFHLSARPSERRHLPDGCGVYPETCVQRKTRVSHREEKTNCSGERTESGSEMAIYR